MARICVLLLSSFSKPLLFSSSSLPHSSLSLSLSMFCFFSGCLGLSLSLTRVVNVCMKTAKTIENMRNKNTFHPPCSHTHITDHGSPPSRCNFMFSEKNGHILLAQTVCVVRCAELHASRTLASCHRDVNQWRLFSDLGFHSKHTHTHTHTRAPMHRHMDTHVDRHTRRRAPILYTLMQRAGVSFFVMWVQVCDMLSLMTCVSLLVN